MNNINNTSSSSEQIQRLALAALFAALCYIGFQFLRFDISVGPEKTAIHFGNAFCVIAALLIGGLWGGLAGAVGMTIADVTSGYVTSALPTFVLKLCIGLVVGLVAHRLFHLSTETSKKKITFVCALSASAGMLFNLVADPIVRYLYKVYILGIHQDVAAVWAKMGAITTLINALTSVFITILLYGALRPVLQKAGLFHTLTKSSDKSNQPPVSSDN